MPLLKTGTLFTDRRSSVCLTSGHQALHLARQPDMKGGAGAHYLIRFARLFFYIVCYGKMMPEQLRSNARSY
jgi:hypothetical protein